MLLGKIAGTVVATRKEEKLEGKKLLIVAIIDPETKDTSDYQVAIDTVGAGAGQTVILVRGSSARMAGDMTEYPVDCSIVGIVDTIDFYGGPTSKS